MRCSGQLSTRWWNVWGDREHHHLHAVIGSTTSICC
jgi:hypothetical protein